MNRIAIAKETIRITELGKYEVNGKTVALPAQDFAQTAVYSPERGAALVQAFTPREGAALCRIAVTNEDSFSAARALGGVPLVMNFANAHHAGGGFLLGAQAQEEALCRCSTLYASLTSPAAKEMYHYNNRHLSRVESDYMLLSPQVCVFRDAECSLLPEPFAAAVITAPAPNRRGAALFASAKLIEETFLRRIRILLSIAADCGYRDLVLGAWGCGAFGNDPQKVAGAFRQALVNERFGTAFDRVRFAVYGNPEGKNFRAFSTVFANAQ